MSEQLHRNNPRMPLIRNGRRRHGQFEWHDENCLMEDYGIKRSPTLSGDFFPDFPPIHYLWCATHGQWASESPVSVTFTWDDGTTSEYKL